jgi:hypothetical protein
MARHFQQLLIAFARDSLNSADMARDFSVAPGVFEIQPPTDEQWDIGQSQLHMVGTGFRPDRLAGLVGVDITFVQVKVNVETGIEEEFAVTTWASDDDLHGFFGQHDKVTDGPSVNVPESVNYLGDLVQRYTIPIPLGGAGTSDRRTTIWRFTVDGDFSDLVTLNFRITGARYKSTSPGQNQILIQPI